MRWALCLAALAALCSTGSSQATARKYQGILSIVANFDPTIAFIKNRACSSLNFLLVLDPEGELVDGQNCQFYTAEPNPNVTITLDFASEAAMNTMYANMAAKKDLAAWTSLVEGSGASCPGEAAYWDTTSTTSSPGQLTHTLGACAASGVGATTSRLRILMADNSTAAVQCTYRQTKACPSPPPAPSPPPPPPPSPKVEASPPPPVVAAAKSPSPPPPKATGPTKTPSKTPTKTPSTTPSTTPSPAASPAPSKTPTKAPTKKTPTKKTPTTTATPAAPRPPPAKAPVKKAPTKKTGRH